MIGYEPTVLTLPAPADPVPTTSPDAVEAEAIRWRAVHDVVPYFVWKRLSDDARARIAVLTQERARWHRRHDERAVGAA